MGTKKTSDRIDEAISRFDSRLNKLEMKIDNIFYEVFGDKLPKYNFKTGKFERR